MKNDFILQPMFSPEKPFLSQEISYYRTHFVYPLSYVIRLCDEAEWHYRNSHEKNLPENVRSEIFALSDQRRKLFLPLAVFMTEHLGRTVDAVNRYSRQERDMLDLYRRHKHSSKAPGVPWGIKPE